MMLLFGPRPVCFGGEGGREGGRGWYERRTQRNNNQPGGMREKKAHKRPHAEETNASTAPLPHARPPQCLAHLHGLTDCVLPSLERPRGFSGYAFDGQVRKGGAFFPLLLLPLRALLGGLLLLHQIIEALRRHGTKPNAAVVVFVVVWLVNESGCLHHFAFFASSFFSFLFITRGERRKARPVDPPFALGKHVCLFAG